MDIEKFDADKSYIKQHNAITSGRYEYTSAMLDILFMTLAMMDSNKPENRTFQIFQRDIETITGHSWNYQQLREATESIGSRMFEIETPKSLKQLWLFSSVEYLIGTGSFVVKINEDAMPYFFELKNNFTMLHLKSVLSCSSKFAKRLYAIACQWRSVGSVTFDIIELKRMLGLISKDGKEQYDRISEFKSKVLELAQKQINEYTDIDISFELIKRGRSFQKVKLLIDKTPTKQQELPLYIDYSKSVEQNIKEATILQFKNSIMMYGISDEYADILSKKISRNEFEKETQALNKKIAAEKDIDSWTTERIAKYLVGVFQNKGVLPRKV
ncbi:replication initiation protein [Capnocytophaga granulosa]|uniref:replication initiation protein n=1 Tax=Capnocytophaga granulosa TaxID=45242 RepID=UPI003857B4A2